MNKTLPKTVEPEVTQIYETERGDIYQILYVDEQVVLLREDREGRSVDNVHRVERRVQFDKEVENGFFQYKPESSLDMMDISEIDWADVNYIGVKTAENLHDAGFDTNLDIQQADEGELLDVDGVGKKGAANLRDFAR